MKAFVINDLEGLLPASLFHAAALMSIEGLFLITPRDTFISIGYFDDPRKILDLSFCEQNNIKIIRRQAGGGAVLISQGQLLYQVVFSRKDKTFPLKLSSLYYFFSRAVIETYRRIGIKTFIRPINDIVTKEEKKISGQGAGDIGSMTVFVGNIISHFNEKLFVDCLKIESSFAKENVKKLLEESMSSVYKELSFSLPYEFLEELLIDSFSKIIRIDSIEIVPDYLIEKAYNISKELSSKEELFKDSPKKHDLLKIKEGLFVRPFKSRRIEGLAIVENGIVKDILSPDDVPTILKALIGIPYSLEEFNKALERIA